MRRTLVGWVVEPETGLGIAGVTVSWRVGKAAGDGPELGSARSGPEGDFALEVRDEPEALEAFCRAGNGRDHTSWVLLLDRDEQLLGEPLAVEPEAQEVRVPLCAGEAEPTVEALHELAGWLATRRMLETGELAQELLSPSPGSPAMNWTAAARGAAVRQMAHAVREHEPRRALWDLVDDPVYLEPQKLLDGDLVGAVGHFRVDENIRAHIHDFGSFFPRLPKSDVELYRDYLRGIWAAAARDMYGRPDEPEDLFNRQLEYRFFQDLTTGDHNPQPAAALAHGVLRRLLVAGPDRGGFGLAAAAIPAQGAEESDHDYLQMLIALSGVSAGELRNRVRIRFDRPPDEQLHPVQLNVEALLGLLSDTWQTPVEPFNVQPVPQGNGNPLLFGPHVGRAPFYLQYEEWLNRKRFFAENAYDIRRNIPWFGQEFRDYMPSHRGSAPLKDPSWSAYFGSQAEFAQAVDWLAMMFPAVDALRDALAKYDALDYAAAEAGLGEAEKLIGKALTAYKAQWVTPTFAWDAWSIDGRISLKSRARLRPKSRGELDAFERFFDMPYFPMPGPQLNASDYDRRIISTAHARSLYYYNLLYLRHVLVPYLQSLVATARGDLAKAVRLLAPLTGVRVGVAEVATPGVYARSPYPAGDPRGRALLFQDSALPYTAATPLSEDQAEVWPPEPFKDRESGELPSHLAMPAFEHAFFRLAQGDAMLSWADQLYRDDEPASIRRARELYKAVMFLHGETPDINPEYRWQPYSLFDPLLANKNATVNPARVSQLMRARLGFLQIELGLNAYGYDDDLVPVLRYRPLQAAADTFAAAARSAQGDFLAFQGKYEQARIDILQTQNLLKRAAAGQGIAAERQELAKVGVAKAEEQVKAVEAEIARKRAEAADADSFFGQAKAFFGGIKDSLTDLVPLAKGVAGDQSAAGSVSGEQLLGMLKASTGGGAAAKQAAVATLGSGAGLAIGFGAFAYYGYTTMSSMADEANKRQADIRALETSGIEAARAQVRLRQREVTIANFEAAIAEADASLARELYRFHQDRFLNAEFWRRMALLAQNLMRRYVELGARTAWMAERALAFEQGRVIDIIRLNYVPYQLRGVGGADRLQADLAELEAARIAGARATAPVKHSISLAREFPLAFGQLKATGRCTFRTAEAALQLAYPRMYGYRVRSVTVAADPGDGPPPKGLLRNSGLSLTSREDGSMARLVRYADALPLSEFRLHDDLFVYGLPGETLLQFEGSGFESGWELEFPPAANPHGLGRLSDVVLTFDMNATYNSGVKPPAVAAFSRGVMLAASVHDRAALNKLRTGGDDPVRFRFDLARLALPGGEANRTITQMALLVVGHTPGNYAALVELPADAASANITLEQGLGLTNNAEMLGTAAPLPLNALAGLKADQAIEVEILPAGAEEELARALDVVLYLEYSADPA